MLRNDNAQFMKENLVHQWEYYFHKMFQGREPAAKVPLAQEMDFDTSLKGLYGTKMHGCVGDSEA